MRPPMPHLVWAPHRTSARLGRSQTSLRPASAPLPLGARSPRNSGGSPSASPRTIRRTQPRSNPTGRRVPPYTWWWTFSPIIMASATQGLKVNPPPRQGGSWSSLLASYNNSCRILYHTTRWTLMPFLTSLTASLLARSESAHSCLAFTRSSVIPLATKTTS